MDRGITYIKAFAILGVLFHHIGNRRLNDETLELIGHLSAAFGWCVLAFFAVSGWLHALGEKKRAKSWIEFTSGKTLRLLLPFILLCVLYSFLMQLVESMHLIQMQDVMPAGLDEKIRASLWPVGNWRAGEQLYFLPLLFAVALTFHSAVRLGGAWVVWILTGICVALGLAFFSDGGNTGFSWNMLIWGGACYGSGYLMYLAQSSRLKWLVTVVLAVTIFAVGGIHLWPKVFPIVLLACLSKLRNLDLPWISHVGEASGTIYIYHTPFILQPMVIAASHLTTTASQVLGAVAAAFVAIAICCLVYFGLKDTRFKWVLM